MANPPPTTANNERDYRRLAMVLPTWARRCLRVGHDISLLDKPNGRIEVFCGECYKGAGKGEILTEGQTALLLREYGR
jgi:hypothetical protein